MRKQVGKMKTKLIRQIGTKWGTRKWCMWAEGSKGNQSGILWGCRPSREDTRLNDSRKTSP